MRCWKSVTVANSGLAGGKTVNANPARETRPLDSTHLIITADDFGLSRETTLAITEAFGRGLVTHASITANMPDFDHACSVASEREVRDRIGVHLVLTEGIPLTDPIQSCLRFCDEHGHFRYWRSADHAFHLRRVERDAVSRELRAQITRCRDHGLSIAHLDSHHHVHNKRAIGRIVISLARDLRVPRVRLAHNCGPRLGFVNRAYKAWFNSRLRRAGLAGTRWYGSLEDFIYVKESGVPASRLEGFELNVHPVYRNGVLVDLAHPGQLLEELLASAGLPPKSVRLAPQARRSGMRFR